MRKILLSLFFTMIWSYSNIVSAIDHKERFELNLGSELPFYMGVQFRYNITAQYYSKLSSGFAMQFLMRSYQKVLEGFGYERNTALALEALFNSFVSDVRIGWATNVNEGFFIELGYHLMLWGKGEVSQEFIDSILNVDSGNILSADNIYAHTLHHGPILSIGYKMTLIDKLSLSLAVSGYKPIFSHARVEYSANSTPVVNGTSDTVSTQLENQSLGDLHNEVINNMIVKKLFFVSLGVWFGLKF